MYVCVCVYVCVCGCVYLCMYISICMQSRHTKGIPLDKICIYTQIKILELQKKKHCLHQAAEVQLVLCFREV